MHARDIFENYRPGDEKEAGDREAILRLFDAFSGNVAGRENGVAHLTASCWITDERRERVVMAWHNIYRSWSWIGGHADGDEDLPRVARKEAFEETGLQCRVEGEAPVSVELMSVWGHIRRGVWVPAHLHMNATYLLIADGKEKPRAMPEENRDVRWMTPEEALRSSDEKLMLPIYEKLIMRTRGATFA